MKNRKKTWSQQQISSNQSSEEIPAKFKKEGMEIAVAIKKDFNGIKEIIGTKDTEIGESILFKTVLASDAHAPLSAQSLNTSIQSFYDQKPKDAVESRLVSQITALYSQGMAYLYKADKSSRFEHMQYYGNLAIKCLRLHNETVEALSRYRRGGEQKSAICGAKARTNGHKPCRQPAMTNGRCRLHGGLCTGAKTKEGRRRIKAANTKHGFYSAEALIEREKCRNLIKIATANC